MRAVDRRLGAELLDTCRRCPGDGGAARPDAAGRFSVDDGGRAGRGRHRLPIRRARNGRLSFRLPGAGVINPLRWRPHPWGEDLRENAPPEQVQPMSTTFERAASAGVAVSVVSGAEFTGSGLTRAVLRGGRYVGVQASVTLPPSADRCSPEGGFCYGYHGEVDLLGHFYGPGSPAWRMQLRQVDRLVESVVEGLRPAGCSRSSPTTAWWPART